MNDEIDFDSYDMDHLGNVPTAYQTIEPLTNGAMNAVAKHALCAYFHNGECHVDLFLLDSSKAINVELAKVEAAGSGTLFNDMVFICWFGLTTTSKLRQNLIDAMIRITNQEYKELEKTWVNLEQERLLESTNQKRNPQ